MGHVHIESRVCLAPFQHTQEKRSLHQTHVWSRMKAPTIARWTIGAGGFIGEITLKELSESDYYIRGRSKRKFVELTDLHIHPLRRRRGWADSLITTALRYAKRRNWCVFLRCVPYNKPRVRVAGLIALYSKYGFKSLKNDEREMVLKW